jgi:macrolide-specific efflux system membrane fusion protein
MRPRLPPLSALKTTLDWVRRAARRFGGTTLRAPLALNIALGVLVLGGVGWAYQLVAAPAAATTSAATGVGGSRTVAVSQGTVVATATATGSVQSANTAAADFVTAGTVTSILVRVGDTVTKGQVLAKVDPTDAQAQLDTANANLTAAKASLTRAKASADDASIASAQAQVTTAKGSVDAATRALAGTTLKAPMAGTVTAVNASVGGSTSGTTSSSGSSGGGQGASGSASSSSSASSSGFIQLADLAHMQVSANFAEADATLLKAGQAATVTWAALANTTAPARVATIAPTATTSNSVNSYGVVLSLDQVPAAIRIGQTVTVTVTTAQADNAIRVPASALRTNGTRHLVTVVVNGAAEVRAVEIGVEGNSFVEVTSGLTVGEQVVIVTATSTATTGTTGG